MSFPFLDFLVCIIANIYDTRRYNNSFRKEEGFGFSRKGAALLTEKASVSASRKARIMEGSITVEAVVCLPLFLYASICLIWLLELRSIQLVVREGMQGAGKELAQECYELPLLIPARVESKIVSLIGEERLDRSCIVEGSEGLECEKSYIWPGSAIIELKTSYQVKLPFPQFLIPPIRYQESMRIKGWTGYVKQSFGQTGQQEIVYITETGIVYHRDYHCTYLEPSVRLVSLEEIESLRNQSSGKYYPCELCGRFCKGNAYITDYGNRYHSTLDCSGVKRKIYAVPIREVKGKGACSKCGK